MRRCAQLRDYWKTGIKVCNTVQKGLRRMLITIIRRKRICSSITQEAHLLLNYAGSAFAPQLRRKRICSSTVGRTKVSRL
jgi:hypothetical protein